LVYADLLRLTFLGWPFNFVGFLSLFALYLWVLWAQ
jgi:hypothetical protein